MSGPPALPPWSKVHERRKALERRWPSIFSIPLVRRASDLVLREARPGLRVLEAGAGDRRMKERLETAAPGLVYRSADPDPSFPHDFPDVFAASGEYDLVFAFELIEHLTAEDALAFLRRCRELTAPGGRIVLGTPDVFTPGRWHRDAGHLTPFSPWELGGFVEEAGYRVESLHRAWNGSFGERVVRRCLLGWVHRLTGADYAHSVTVTAVTAGGLQT